MKMNKQITYATLTGTELGQDFKDLFSVPYTNTLGKLITDSIAASKNDSQTLQELTELIGMKLLTVRTVAASICGDCNEEAFLLLEILTEEYNLTPFIFYHALPGSNQYVRGGQSKEAFNMLHYYSFNKLRHLCEDLARNLAFSQVEPGKSLCDILKVPESFANGIPLFSLSAIE